MKSNLIDVMLHLHHETPKAYLLSDDGEEKNAKWLAKSQCEATKLPNSKDTYEVTLPEWIAKQNGWL
jgi:hypothetical protein